MRSKLSRDEILDLVRRYVELVSKTVKLYAAILFGSYARGDYGPWSDADLLLIGEFNAPYLERLRMLIDLSKDIPIAIEPHPYTVDEALSMLEKGSPTIVDALEEGLIILKREKFERILERYREMKRRGKLKRSRTSISF